MEFCSEVPSTGENWIYWKMFSMAAKMMEHFSYEECLRDGTVQPGGVSGDILSMSIKYLETLCN